MSTETVYKYRNPAVRGEDFRPAKSRLSPVSLAVSAGKCSGCHGANRCVISIPNVTTDDKKPDVIITACPIGRNIPAFNSAAARGDRQAALMIDWADGNLMPALTGRLCPASHATSVGSFCQTTCIHSTVYPAHENPEGSVEIGSVEAEIGEWAIDNNRLPHLNPLNFSTGQSVGYIGDGAASFLVGAHAIGKGHHFSMYGSYHKPGGILAREIVGFKFDQKYLDAYFNHLADNGGTIHTNTTVDAEKLRELAKEHNVLVMGIGKSAGRKADLGGDAANSQINYQYLLDQQNKATAKGQALVDFTDGALDARGKVTAVMGMGETAMDCVRTLLRNGANTVEVHYYKGPESVSSDPVDRRLAFEEGGAVMNDDTIALLKKDGLSDEDIDTLSGANEQGRVKFIFDSQVQSQDYKREQYILTYNQGDQIKRTILGMPLFVATGADVDNPIKQFGLPDVAVSSSGTLIVDRVPEYVGHPSNNPNMLVSGLAAIFEIQMGGGAKKYTPLLALGDCVSDSQGKNGPTVFVHSLAGAKALRDPINECLENPSRGQELAKRYPHLVIAV